MNEKEKKTVIYILTFICFATNVIQQQNSWLYKAKTNILQDFVSKKFEPPISLNFDAIDGCRALNQLNTIQNDDEW